MQRLFVSENRRGFVTEDGKPFFWLGDTAWELFHKLSIEQTEHYFKTRKEQGFNVIQAVLLGEEWGLTAPNFYGRIPLCDCDPERPDLAGEYNYWDHVKAVIELAERYNLYIAVLPTWGDKINLLWGKEKEIFDGDNAFAYGKFVGKLLGGYKNIVWIMGGDRAMTKHRHFQVLNQMAAGLKEGEKEVHIMSFHPPGGSTSTANNADADWLDFVMWQTGHNARELKVHESIRQDWDAEVIRPVLNAEPCYEDHPINQSPELGYFDEYDVREAAYRSVLAGGCGHTYGHHCVWYFAKENQIAERFLMNWEEALERPAAKQMQYVRKLMENYDFIHRKPADDRVVNQLEGANYIVGTEGENYALFYTPNGVRFQLDLRDIHKEITAKWYDPRTGTDSKEFKLKGGIISFAPPVKGRLYDSVLCLAF